jgi:hypothetical protein
MTAKNLVFVTTGLIAEQHRDFPNIEPKLWSLCV